MSVPAQASYLSAASRFLSALGSCRNCSAISAMRAVMRRAGEVAELLAEPIDRHDRLGHRAVAAGAADVAEPPLHELAGVA